MQTVVETPSYLSDIQALFSPAERVAIVARLASEPTCGVLIPGCHGLRKVRFGFGGRGKRSGARIIYLFGGTDIPVFLIAAFAKNEKADLTMAERNALGTMVADMLAKYRRGR
ncbi:MAG: addiction module toxin RelE [Rhodopseudomonas palustris]|uniref:Addiction module toxin RelE n=1 Tax=Rhodopseudomonas palustris TaxID=1076 RepID=A0A933RZQ7_RHOPL|nr:addiction module toxin RelE [Rhodopseudomonas palustris]